MVIRPLNYINFYLLLAANTDSLSTSTSSLGVLTADSESPVVTETTMVPDLLQTFEIITHLGIKLRRSQLAVFTVLDILLPVKEIIGDLVGTGVANNVHDSLKLLSTELTGTLGEINFCLLAANVREAATETSDGSQGVHDLFLAIYVSIENT
jgi:hypothetical protein